MQWRSQLLEGATAVFGEGARADAAPAVDLKVLHAKIGELTLANDSWDDLPRPPAPSLGIQTEKEGLRMIRNAPRDAAIYGAFLERKVAPGDAGSRLWGASHGKRTVP
jgi:hypothetical protein